MRGPFVLRSKKIADSGVRMQRYIGRPDDSVLISQSRNRTPLDTNKSRGAKISIRLSFSIYAILMRSVFLTSGTLSGSINVPGISLSLDVVGANSFSFVSIDIFFRTSIASLQYLIGVMRQ